MTWLEFNNEIKDLLPVDATRLNITGTYLNKLIRQAVIDLQSLIPYYRTGHETVFASTDFVTEEYASVGTMPSGAEPRDAYYVSNVATDPCNRKPLVPYTWANRFDLVCANIQVPGCHFAISIDPQGERFYVFPEVEEDRQVEMFWDGRKIVFVDSDNVPFDEGAVMAASEWCSAHIKRKADNDIPAYESYMQSYRVKKLQLFSDMRDRLRFKSNTPSSQQSNACGNTLCAS